MANPGQLRIQNKSKYYMTCSVPQNDGWANCCDAPKPGFSVGPVPPQTTSDYFTFVRTDGHGCNGRQGQFAFTPSIPTYVASPQQFSFDSDAAMALVGPNPNYASQLIDDGSHNYTWVVTPTE
jgi:hypothetical protein